MSVRLRAAGIGDLECPSCYQQLEWDDDRLYSFHLEDVVCGECGHPFKVKRVEKVEYLIHEFHK